MLSEKVGDGLTNNTDKKKTWKSGTRRPIFALLLLAPMCGEVLSGSAPPLEFINPVGFLFLVMLYGSGALLIREFVRRWGKGWPSILLLGLAYGIYEEGIVVRSFFDPTWGDLDRLAWYGRWLGVNWIWTIELTLFHAVISIAIPILLVELMYPEQRHKLWVTRRGLKIHALLLASMSIIGIAFEMRAPPLGYLGCILAMILLAWLAYRWPERDQKEKRVRLPRQWRIGLFGFLGMVGFFITLWVIPENEVPVGWCVAACFALPVLVLYLAGKLGIWSFGLRQQWALATGALMLWILFAFLAVAGPDMPIAGLIFLVFLWRLGRNIRKRETAILQGEGPVLAV